MKTLKIMAIIGICLFSLILITAFSADKNIDSDSMQGAAGCGALYGIAFSIVALVQTNRLIAKIRGATPETAQFPSVSVQSKSSDLPSFEEDLRKLAKLKQDGIISEEEFNTKKKAMLGL